MHHASCITNTLIGVVRMASVAALLDGALPTNAACLTSEDLANCTFDWQKHAAHGRWGIVACRATRPVASGVCTKQTLLAEKDGAHHEMHAGSISAARSVTTSERTRS